jgi:hypothetical protein
MVLCHSSQDGLRQAPNRVTMEVRTYLGGGLEGAAATRVPVWGWKAGTTSWVYRLPSSPWFRLTLSVITSSPVS